MREQQRSFVEDDSVVVRPEVVHPELDTDLEGWQGRITEITIDGEFGELICVEWDSYTLKEMPPGYIETAEEAGIDWTRTWLLPEALLPVDARDTPADATRVATELSEKYEWAFLGEQGLRIQQILASAADDTGALARWAQHLGQNLSFPFEAEVIDFQEQGPLQIGDVVTVKRMRMVDDTHGVIVAVTEAGNNYDFPLCDLEVVDENATNYQLVEDYGTWFENS
jgi:hypothetical protein